MNRRSDVRHHLRRQGQGTREYAPSLHASQRSNCLSRSPLAQTSHLSFSSSSTSIAAPAPAAPYVPFPSTIQMSTSNYLPPNRASSSLEAARNSPFAFASCFVLALRSLSAPFAIACFRSATLSTTLIGAPLAPFVVILVTVGDSATLAIVTSWSRFLPGVPGVPGVCGPLGEVFPLLRRLLRKLSNGERIRWYVVFSWEPTPGMAEYPMLRAISFHLFALLTCQVVQK